jgi:BirA family biotin operon repressor/biotin-[acetyl-CoA-carboxylase] ligase
MDEESPRDAAPTLTQRLRTAVVGRQVEVRDTVTSTNDVARELALAGAPEGLVVIAEEQTAGRGRRGRTWAGPRGKSLLFSVLLRPDVPAPHVPHLSLLAALAACRGILGVAGLDARPKWPNDITILGHKTGGVLVETLAPETAVRSPGDRLTAIIGIGLNVKGRAADYGPDVPPEATTIEQQAGQPVERLDVLCAVLEELDALYRRYRAEGGGWLLDLWRSQDTCLGQPVRVEAADSIIEGRATDVADDGALVVMTPEGLSVAVHAGDVRVRAN